jgi:ubiquinone/menaquinone biosynthesis C-methylase UbiE
MNALEHFFCSSSIWRYLTHRQMLPWILSDATLGNHVLEIGAGYGAGTPELLKRAGRVTSLEYDHNTLLKGNRAPDAQTASVLCGDAAHLPFANETFSSVVGILVLHHLRDQESQNLAFAELMRVLQPGGTFFAFEINDTWFHRAIHYKSTFTPVSPGSAFARLTGAGFARIRIDFRHGGYRLQAKRAKAEELSCDLYQGKVPESSDDMPRGLASIAKSAGN